MTIYDELAALFIEFGYEWKLDDGVYITPSATDIKSVVDAACAMLYDSALNSNIETGRLIIQKVSDDNKFAIYLHIGDTE